MISPMERFLNEAPTAELLAELARFEPSELDGLITQLEEGSQRAHLEALGASSGFAKAVRKAAKKAAYRLKSKGVSSEWRPAQGLSFKAADEPLGDVGAMAMPGLHGNWIFILRSLGEEFAVSATCEEGRVVDSDTAGTLSISRIRKIVAAEAERTDRALVLVVGGDLAVRSLARIEEELAIAGEDTPGDWQAVRWWRDEAVRRGADGARADARAALADKLATLPLDVQRTTLGLFGAPGVTTPLVASESAYQSLERELHDACHSPLEMDQATFRERVEGIQAQVTDEWLADPVKRQLMGSWLDGNADFLWAAGQERSALQCLWLADRARDLDLKPSEIEFFQDAVGLAVDFGLAWGAYQEIKSGADGGDHGGHDHRHRHHHHHHGAVIADPLRRR